MSSNTINLPAPGQRVGVVDGPGQNPKDNAGTVICHITNRWGTYALVMMDGGKLNSCHRLNDGPGIGYHLI